MRTTLTRAAGALALSLAMVGTSVPVLAADAPAQDSGADLAARLQAAGELVEIMHLDTQLEALMPQIVNVMMNALMRGNGGHEEQIKTILIEEFSAAFTEQRPEFLAGYKQIYADNLTLVEIEGMKSFYSSAVGRSVLAKTPKMTQDGMQGGVAIGQKAAASALPRVLKRMQDAQMDVPKGV